MREFWEKLRYKIAYLLAHEWIDDLEYRLGAFLCEQTGGILSKSNHTVETMVSVANYYQQRLCDECRQEAESEEIERLTAEKDSLIRNYKACAMEAVKDFAERLKARVKEAANEQPDGGHICENEIVGIINETVAEMDG